MYRFVWNVPLISSSSLALFFSGHLIGFRKLSRRLSAVKPLLSEIYSSQFQWDLGIFSSLQLPLGKLSLISTTSQILAENGNCTRVSLSLIRVLSLKLKADLSSKSVRISRSLCLFPKYPLAFCNFLRCCRCLVFLYLGVVLENELGSKLFQTSKDLDFTTASLNIAKTCLNVKFAFSMAFTMSSLLVQPVFHGIHSSLG